MDGLEAETLALAAMRSARPGGTGIEGGLGRSGLDKMIFDLVLCLFLLLPLALAALCLLLLNPFLNLDLLSVQDAPGPRTADLSAGTDGPRLRALYGPEVPQHGA